MSRFSSSSSREIHKINKLESKDCPYLLVLRVLKKTGNPIHYLSESYSFSPKKITKGDGESHKKLLLPHRGKQTLSLAVINKIYNHLNKTFSILPRSRPSPLTSRRRPAQFLTMSASTKLDSRRKRESSG